MDLKRGVKEITKHEEFGAFSDPIKAENKSEEIAKDKNQEGEIIFGNFGSAGAQTEGWGNFKVENQEKISQEVKEDGWATFTDPVNQNELANESKDESKKVPFASDEDPFKDAFSTKKLDKQPEEKDNDSDFGDFEDPVENIPSASDFKVSEDIQNSEVKNIEICEKNDLQMSENIQISEENKTPLTTKEFNEKEMFEGFMKTVSQLSKSHTPTHAENQDSKNSSIKEIPSTIEKTSIKAQLMKQIAKAFGESENIDLDHLKETETVIYTIELLKGKLENKTEMEAVANQLIKLENYKAAEKIWDHNEVVEKIAKILEAK